MEFFETDAQSKDYAKAAMDIMVELDVSPNPNNFALWYAYCSKQFPELNERIDSVLKESHKLTSEDATSIYETFFGNDETTEAIRDTSKKIQESVAQILEYVDRAGDDTAQYGQILQDFSGRLSVEAKVESLRELVDDVLVETHRMEEQSRKVESQLRASSSEVVSLKQNLETIRHEALTDDLTGIANRKSFDSSLRRIARESIEEETRLCLLLADIDHFKRFNDTWGHSLGDQVLKLVARTLVECIKGRDLAARYGGEEFTVILPQTQLEDAVTLAQNICVALATKKVVKRATGEDLGTITLSIGAALFRPGESLGELVRRADTALYAAKQRGRNRVLSETDIEAAAE